MNGPELEPLHCILCYSYLIGSDEWVVSVRPQDIHPESSLFGRTAVAPVYVNGRMVTHGEQQLVDGDFVRMGQCTFFQIRIPSPPPVPIVSNPDALLNNGAISAFSPSDAGGGGGGGGGGGSVSKSGASVQFAVSSTPAIANGIPSSIAAPSMKPVTTNGADADPTTTTASHDDIDTKANDDGNTSEATKKKVKPLLFGREAEEVIIHPLLGSYVPLLTRLSYLSLIILNGLIVWLLLLLFVDGIRRKTVRRMHCCDWLWDCLASMHILAPPTNKDSMVVLVTMALVMVVTMVMTVVVMVVAVITDMEYR